MSLGYFPVNSIALGKRTAALVGPSLRERLAFSRSSKSETCPKSRQCIAESLENDSDVDEVHPKGRESC